MREDTTNKPLDLVKVNLNNFNKDFKLSYMSKILLMTASTALVFYIYSDVGIGYWQIKDLILTKDDILNNN